MKAMVLAMLPFLAMPLMADEEKVTGPIVSTSWTGGMSYAYDAAGNVTEIGTDRFVYDHVDRLVSDTVSGKERRHAYDAFGNRTSCADVSSGGDCQGATIVNSTNRISGATYDAAGNLTAYSGNTYTYDATGMLIRDTAVAGGREYVYTASGERIAVVQSSTSTWNWTLRDFSGKVLREMTSTATANGSHTNWTWTKDNIWRDSQLLSSLQRSGASTSTFHYHLDHLGTPRLVSNTSGTIIGVHDYAAFGTEMSGNLKESPESRLKFTGHERDTMGGSTEPLDYMHARFYNGRWGRFLSVDPYLDIEKTMYNPQMWNRYAYVMNNPLRYTDPTGKSFWSILGKGAIEVLAYAGRKSERLVARIVPKTKKEGMDAIKTAIRQAKQEGATSVSVVTPTSKRADAVAGALSDNGKFRGPERSGNWSTHRNPATGEFADVHVQTAADTKKAGLGTSLLSLVAATTLTATSNADAAPSEIVSAVLWDTAKAIDPLFVTDAIEYATGLNEYTEPPPEP
jgi:RHS repeat-associated protein